MGRRVTGRAKGVLAIAATCALLAGGFALPHFATADPEEVTQASVDVNVPTGAIELRDHDFVVRLHPDFPQVVDYRIGDLQLAGRLGGALTSVLVDGERQPVTVGEPVVSADASSATYHLGFPNLAGVSLDVVVAVARDTLTMQLTNLTDPDRNVHDIQIPDLDLVTVGSEDPAAQLTAGNLASGDVFEDLATADPGTAQGSWLVLASDSLLAAAFESNAGPGVDGDPDERWQRRVREDGDTTYGSVSPGAWTWQGDGLRSGSEPFLRVRITQDANADGVVTWQDAAVAARDILEYGNGADDVRYEVVTREAPLAANQLPQTRYDTKSFSVATDNLAQRVLLEGDPEELASSNEVHALAEDGDAWNTVYGFDIQLDDTTPEATLERLADLRSDSPDNIDWLRFEDSDQSDLADRRVGEELQEQGWVVSSTTPAAFASSNIGAPGGDVVESQVIRFVLNSTRDGWAEHPLLPSATSVPGADRDAILSGVWQQNLPAKFLQESDIMTWDADRVTFANGTVSQGTAETRTFSYDGALVLDGDSYLLPWYDGGTTWNSTGQERLYHYNLSGGTTQWRLTDTWRGQPMLKLYELTDTGRKFVTDVTPIDGRITLTAEAAVAYVLYSTEALPEDVDPGPSPTPTSSPTPTPTPSPSATPTSTPTSSPTPSATETASPTPSTSPTGSESAPTRVPTSSAPPTPALEYPQKLYQQPGTHYYNGRHWYTRCEPYSSTFRCWTSIWSTQVVRDGAGYAQTTGWHFNNLTYLPSPRALWSENNLGHTSHWTAADGRDWYTECDTPSTGRNGCRSYTRTKYVRATANPAGGWTYATETGWVFNNIVLFG